MRLPRVVGRKALHATKWLRLLEVTYQDLDGVERAYSAVERTTRPPSADADAVVVLPLLSAPTGPVAVLVRQFRPPLDKWIVELPAGLIDAGESVATTVQREIKEETGYDVSEIVSIGPVVASDPGLTSSTCRFVVARVTSDGAPTPALEATEMIQVLHAPLATLLETLHARETTHGDAIDSRLYSFALGQHLRLL
ncbi:hypothetical protein SPRG_08249 [Saprolegnia parasitica CBS 223.65]|uniref:Nudix hydrolase domain-containing protein n=1 Tax=Saprolegnia parasitica (strain CBS 223.65) TaxID=695850 RepID=A0A067CIR5_SAPPC|nr:hypothetical protein SPRG_08249 [Saprolegnia parasitica CBS 223.65]KDO26446.1 hypothetical protein SPRG_08249 [Saprolegnia parasitica CBS 223.65]|eukprot:XP_012202882.1 hypothetical protein SPRG_08249 [Saprolegnia parasitica CBS 223.65]